MVVMDAAQSSNSGPVLYGVLLKATENWNGVPSAYQLDRSELVSFIHHER